MKKLVAIILLCCILTCCACGCSDSKTALDCVDLCDYTALTVPVEDYTVSEDDLSTAVQLHLSALDMEDAVLTDDIAVTYFRCENAVAAQEKIKREMVENRFFEAARDLILEASQIRTFPNSSDAYVDRMVAMQAANAQAEEKSLGDYLSETYGMDEKSFREAALWGYGDYLILKAIAQREGYEISQEDRSREIDQAVAATGMTGTEVLAVYGQEFFDTILYEEFLKSLLLERYAQQIDAVMVQ